MALTLGQLHLMVERLMTYSSIGKSGTQITMAEPGCHHLVFPIISSFEAKVLCTGEQIHATILREM
jgi:hypothetical protein